MTWCALHNNYKNNSKVKVRRQSVRDAKINPGLDDIQYLTIRANLHDNDIFMMYNKCLDMWNSHNKSKNEKPCYLWIAPNQFSHHIPVYQEKTNFLCHLCAYFGKMSDMTAKNISKEIPLCLILFRPTMYLLRLLKLLDLKTAHLIDRYRFKIYNVYYCLHWTMKSTIIIEIPWSMMPETMITLSSRRLDGISIIYSEEQQESNIFWMTSTLM